MAKPDITLEPSKGVISQMAARIYAAYITRGAVREGEEADWMQRSIREAVRIAKTVDASIESENESNASEPPPDAVSEPPAASTSVSNPTASGAAASAQEAVRDMQFDKVMEEVISGEEDDSTHGAKE